MKKVIGLHAVMNALKKMKLIGKKDGQTTDQKYIEVYLDDPYLESTISEQYEQYI